MTPTHAATPCLETGCYRDATIRGRCTECQLLQGGAARVVYDSRRGSPRERGYDRTWERRRKAWLEIEPFCRTCGQPGNQVDHVITHRGAAWLFDLVGNLQTLCRQHHTQKTATELTIPIGMMYPLDLPKPPHYRPTRLICGPMDDPRGTFELEGDFVIVYQDRPDLEGRNRALASRLTQQSDATLVLMEPAPRTAERAFWSYVMDALAELQEPPIEWTVDGHPSEWWDAYMVDARAEEAMARRLS